MELIVKLVDSENPRNLSSDHFNRLAKFRGDIINCYDEDGRVYGRKESKKVWISEGRNPEEYPGKLGVIRVPGMKLSDFAADKMALRSSEWDIFTKEDEVPLAMYEKDKTLEGRYVTDAIALQTHRKRGIEMVLVRGEVRQKTKQRRYAVSLPQNIWTRLIDEGEIVLTPAEFSQYCIDKRLSHA